MELFQRIIEVMQFVAVTSEKQTTVVGVISENYRGDEIVCCSYSRRLLVFIQEPITL